VRDGERHEAASPVRGCACGLYGWYAPDDTRIILADVFGAVEASGRVLLGGHGFRAERARLLAVVIPDRHREYVRVRKLLAKLEDAAVPVFADEAELVAHFPPDDVSELVEHRCDDGCYYPASAQAHFQHFHAAMPQMAVTMAAGSGPLTIAVYAALSPPPPPRWKRYGAIAACVAFLANSAFGIASAVWNLVAGPPDSRWIAAVFIPLHLGLLWWWRRLLVRAWRWGR
jgi:hypothetical protein